MSTASQKPVAGDLVDQLFDAAFNNARDPRSAEYKAGVRAVLNYHVHGLRMPRPYSMGTVQADAFYAGVDEGHAIWRTHRSGHAAGSVSTKVDVLNAMRWAAEDALKLTTDPDRRAAMFAAHLSGGLGSSLIQEVALSQLIYSLVSDKPAPSATGA